MQLCDSIILAIHGHNLSCSRSDEIERFLSSLSVSLSIYMHTLMNELRDS